MKAGSNPWLAAGAAGGGIAALPPTQKEDEGLDPGSLLAKSGLSQPSYAGGAMDSSIGGADGADGAGGALMSSCLSRLSCARVHDSMQPSQTRVGVG